MWRESETGEDRGSAARAGRLASGWLEGGGVVGFIGGDDAGARDWGRGREVVEEGVSWHQTGLRGMEGEGERGMVIGVENVGGGGWGVEGRGFAVYMHVYVMCMHVFAGRRGYWRSEMSDTKLTLGKGGGGRWGRGHEKGEKRDGYV